MAVAFASRLLESARSGQHLIDTIDANYQAAINYYTQKEMAFLKAVSRKEQIDREKFMESITSGFEKNIIHTWETKINQAVVNSGALEIWGGLSGHYKIKDEKKLQVSRELKERIIAQNGKKNIYSILGDYYEEWLLSAIKGKIKAVRDAGENEIYSSFLNYLKNNFKHTGAVTDTSWLRERTYIRPDLASGINKNTGTDANGLHSELQVAFDIEDYRKNNVEQDIQNDSSLLTEYLNSNMFGFSLKRWTDFNGEKALTQATKMGDIINNDYKSSGDKTWNALYAQRWNMRRISQYLINILGPVNIAYVTGVSFEWASEFLANSILYMHIYANGKPQLGIDNQFSEIYPYVASGQIYVRNYKQGRASALQNATMFKMGQGQNRSGDTWWWTRFTIT